jgi:hypothetical protein
MTSASQLPVTEPLPAARATLRALLWCGIASSLLYVVMNVVVAMQWEEYRSASQTISELSAIGAPTRTLWIWLGTAYTALVAAFGWGVRMSARGSHRLKVAGALIVAYGVVGLGWPFAPMHLREVLGAGGGTLTDTLHLVLTGVTVLLMVLAIGFGAAALGPAFRSYSLATVAALLIFGVLTSLEAPGVDANLPTPWIGVWERGCVAAYLLWIVVLARTILRRPV